MWSKRSVESTYTHYLFISFFFSLVDEFRRKFHPLNSYLISERQLFILHLELLLFSFLFFSFFVSYFHLFNIFVSALFSCYTFFLLQCASVCFLFCFIWFTELKLIQFWNVFITYWFRKIKSLIKQYIKKLKKKIKTKLNLNV